MKKMKMATVATVATLGLAFLLTDCSGNATGDGDDLLSSSSSSLASSSSSLVSSSSSSIPEVPVLCLVSGNCLELTESQCSILGGEAVSACSVSSSSGEVVSSSSNSSSSLASSSSFLASGKFTDGRDGQEYSYVTIGSQVWMAENLNYNASGSWCYNDNTSNCVTYGRLYDWATAMAISASYNTSSYGGSDVNHRGVCPSGWHLPSDGEWSALAIAVGGSSKLKSGSGWNSSGNGTDDYGFSALPGGYRNEDGSFLSVGNVGNWWSATESDASNAFFRRLEYNLAGLNRYLYYKEYGFSVRCLRDYSLSSSSSVVSSSSSSSVVLPNSNLGVYWNTSISYGTLSDSRDGKSYRTVKMPDGKIWMAENLNYNASGSWCYGDNTSYCTDYGRLYDWATAMAISTDYNTSSYSGSDVNHRGVCPSGWHLPSDGEWGALAIAVGGVATAWTKLKARSKNGTDNYGFSALAGGFRGLDGLFRGVDVVGYWWSAEEYSASRASGRCNIGLDDLCVFNDHKENGFSVRCLRD